MDIKKIANKALLPVFFLVNLCSSASLAFAKNGEPAESGAGEGTSASGTASTSSFSVKTYLQTEGQKEQSVVISEYIIRFTNFLSLVIGSAALLAIIIGGFMLVTSAGKEASVTRGKDIIKYAIIGLVVAMSAYFITAFVQSIFYEYGQ